MKRLFYIVSLILLSWMNSLAQTSSLSGTITDSETNEIIEFAEVTLLKLPDSTKVSTATSDEKGYYVFTNIPYGSYVLASSRFDYHKIFSTPILLNTDTNSYTFTLKSIIVEGEEVSVLGKRSLVRVEQGKMIVDVEHSLGNSGQTVVDVLRKSPGIAVDQDGKIQLNGKSGVQVMLDDKVMYLSEDQLGNLLKSIPSDLIKEIEIITSPSAKYDAAGNAGIINIRLKKGAYEGINGTANASYGSGVYHKANAGVNLSYKKKRLSFNTGYQYNNKKDLDDTKSYRTNYDPTVVANRLISKTYYTIPGQVHTFTFSGEYKASKKTSLTVDLNDSYSHYSWDGHVNSTLYKQDGAIRNSYYGKEHGDQYAGNYYSSIGFKHTFDTSGTLLSGYGSYNYNTDRETKLNKIEYYDSIGTNLQNPFIFDFHNKGRGKQYNAQVDFVKNFYPKIKFESGIKTVQRDELKPINLFLTENHVLTDASNHFRYIEGVYAAYAMAGGQLGKFSVQGGLRLEHTQVKGSLSLIDSTFHRDYTNLFPSGNIMYKQSDKVSYTVLYSRRITRPSYDQLNPVLNVTDPYSYYGGDPYLLPQLSDNTEFSYSIFGGVIVTTLNYTYIKNPIVWAYLLDTTSDKFISGPRNLNYQKNYGLSISVNKSITKWWSSNNNLLVNTNTFVGQTDYGQINNTMTGWGVKSTQSFTLPKDYSVEISGLYDSPGSYAFSRSLEKWQLNMAVQKKLWNKRGTIKLAYNDMFWTFRYGGTTNTGTTSQTSSYQWDNRTLILSFSYKFGNQLMKID